MQADNIYKRLHIIVVYYLVHFLSQTCFHNAPSSLAVRVVIGTYKAM